MTAVMVWMRKNLFSTWYNTLLTAAAVYFIVSITPPLLNWFIFKANIRGSGPEACTSGGACWVFVKMRFNTFMYGFYPHQLQWRINVSYIIGLAALILLLGGPQYYKKWCAGFLLVIFPAIAFVLYHGGIFGLEQVDTYSWGGLHLTLVVAITGIITSLPLGVLLALGRRSSLPVVRALSIAFIELWRGVPLISVLFMASVLLPLFFPDNLHFDKLLRALIGIALFASAYMAEVVRSGLQVIPQGQYEAARALGLRYWPMMRLVVLPQALKIVIPGIVNTFIGLFKDTTLVLIIGLFDLLGMVQAANGDPKWLKYGLEGYVFAAMVFWCFCFMMSRYSIFLEHKLNSGRIK